MKRYGNLSFIDDLSADLFIDLLNKAIEQEVEEKLWQKWLVELPHIEEDMPFEKYKKMHMQSNTTTNKTDNQILADAESILKMMNRP